MTFLDSFGNLINKGDFIKINLTTDRIPKNNIAIIGYSETKGSFVYRWIDNLYEIPKLNNFWSVHQFEKIKYGVDLLENAEFVYPIKLSSDVKIKEIEHLMKNIRIKITSENKNLINNLVRNRKILYA